MPRIYYSPNETTAHATGIVIHALAYIAGITFVAAMGVPHTLLVMLWTAAMAYHAYAIVPLDEGLQTRTYNRLRNRFGVDWDLAAPPGEFELEQRKARLEQHQRHIPATVWGMLPLLGVWMGQVYLLDTMLPLSIFIAAGLGWLLTVSALTAYLQRQVAETAQRLDARKRREIVLPRSSVTRRLEPRPGMTFTVGDDGELVETPLHQRDSHTS